MTDYIKANGEPSMYSSYKFTSGKYYEVLNWDGIGCAEIKDDRGEKCHVNVGKPTTRLAGRGRFEKVSADVANALDIAKKAEIFAGQSVANVMMNARLQTSHFKPSMAERLAKAEVAAEMHKRDCIKAEAIIDQLYDLFPGVRNGDQLVAAVKQAKIFSDAFIEMQKIK